MRRCGRLNQRGSLLVLSMFVASVLAAVSTAALTRSSTDLMVAKRFVSSHQMFMSTEAGIDCAIAQLRDGADLTAAGANCTTTTRTVTVTQGFNQPIKISATAPATAGSVAVVQIAIVQRTVSSPFRQAAYGDRTDAETGVLVAQGSLVDSYSSALGAYGATISAHPTYGTLNQSQDGLPSSWNGEIRTNSTSPWNGSSAAVVVQDTGVLGPATVRGSAYRSAASSLVYVAAGTGIVTGATTGLKPIQTFALPSPPTAPPAGCTALGVGTNGGDVLIDTASESQNLTGTCYYANSLTVSNSGSTLTLPNLSTLYIYGEMTVNFGGVVSVGQGTIRTSRLLVEKAGSRLQSTGTGGKEGGLVSIYANSFTASDNAVVAGAENLPRRMRIYATSGSTNSTVAYGAQVYGTIYAPNSLVHLISLGGGPWSMVYGSVIGNKCQLSVSGQIHYDEALSTVTGWPAWMTKNDITVLAVGRNLVLGGGVEELPPEG